MREYRFLATDETVEALRALRGAWAGYRVEPTGFGVRLEDGRDVCVRIEASEMEPDLPAFRIGATLGPCDEDAALIPDVAELSRARRRLDTAPDFAIGRNDIVLFTGATWAVGGPTDGQHTLFSGHPGQLPDTATAVCLTTDAVVVASPVGTGFLVRTGVRPYTIKVTDDSNEIATFLAQRGYDG